MSASPPAPVGFDDHPCLSAQASCSGLVPCPACLIALETHCVPQSLLAASQIADQGGEPAAQVKAFFDAFDATRQKLVIEQARVEATREALRTDPPPDVSTAPAPAPALAPPVSAPAPAPAPEPATVASKPRIVNKRQAAPPSQVVPIGRPKRTAAVIAAEAATLDSLFKEAVTPAPETSASGLASTGSSTSRSKVKTT